MGHGFCEERKQMRGLFHSLRQPSQDSNGNPNFGIASTHWDTAAQLGKWSRSLTLVLRKWSVSHTDYRDWNGPILRFNLCS